MAFKQRQQQFRKWQKQPFNYSRDTSTHQCNNCGESFDGNYCPVCGQRAEMGRITWKSVGQGFMELWGLHTRSMPYSLLQLILRPGYFIGDYISGKRQVSFPPVKMLVIMGLVVLLITGWFNPSNAAQSAQSLNEMLSDENQVVRTALLWLEKHYDWTFLLLLSFFIWPVWVLFRHSPRCPNHTLPEGFFIQVFISVMMLILHLFTFLLPRSYPKVIAIVDLSLGLYMLYVTYKQLFGHSAWGTLWRLVVAITVAMLQMAAVIIFFSCIAAAIRPNHGEDDILYLLGIPFFCIPILLVVMIILGICSYIIKRGLKKKDEKEAQESVVESHDDSSE